MFKNIVCKLGNMRKEANWVLYPQQPNKPNIVIIQCDKRIAEIDLETKTAYINSGQKGNSFIHLAPLLGATKINVPDQVIDELKRLLAGTTPGPVRVM